MITEEKKQLIMLHFAGGNCYSFHFLKPYVPAEYSYCPIELPGRGKRMNESLLRNEIEATADLFHQINALRNSKPYILFGHSMGASLAIRVAKRLEEISDPPSRLILAGNAGPGTGEKKSRSSMSDEELKVELSMLGGVENEVLSNDDLFSFFSPIMRADFGLLENALELNDDFKVKIPITAVMGDAEETAGEIENWARFTLKDFKFYLLEGNHFFIHKHPSKLMKIITNGNG